MLISSHILEELSKLATHYGFIHHGKMLKEISADELERSFSGDYTALAKTSQSKAVAAVLCGVAAIV